MGPFELAWSKWFFLSGAGFIFSLIMWRPAAIISSIYSIGSIVLLFTKYLEPSVYGVSKEIWKNSDYWYNYRIIMIVGQLALSAGVFFIGLYIIDRMKKTS